MKTISKSFIALLALTLCFSFTAQAQDTVILMDQLGNPNETFREQGYQELVKMGPPAIGSLIQAVGGENLTADKWAKIAIEQIVNQAAAPGSGGQKKAVVNELKNILLDRAPSDQVNFALLQLTWVGGDDAVPPIAAYLSNPAEREMARYALERIPGEAATNALIRATGLAVDADWKMALIKTLGVRGDANALKAVAQAYKDIDPDVRLTAIKAAGRLKTPKAAGGLWHFMARGNFKEQMAAASALLALAEALTEMGELNPAITIYRRFYERVPVQHLRCAGLRGLFKANCRESFPLVIGALNDSDSEMAGTAFDELLKRPCPCVTKNVIYALETTTGKEHIPLIKLLALRNDPAAGKATPMLLFLYQNRSGDIRDEAKTALVSIPGAETTFTLMGALDKAKSVEERVELLTMLGDRAPIGGIVAFSDAAQDKEPVIRAAGVEALGKLARTVSAPIVQKALTDSDPKVVEAAVAAAIPISAALTDAKQKSQALDLCLAAVKLSKNDETTRAFLGRLRALGAGNVLTEMAGKMGFVTKWWAVGPLGDRNNLKENDLLDPAKVNPAKPVAGDRGRAREWKEILVDDPSGMIDLERQVARRDNVGAYLFAKINVDKAQNAVLLMGSDDDLVCWLNGVKVHQFLGDRGWDPNQDKVDVQLKKGVNTILLKVLNAGGSWSASLRVTDQNGNPVPLTQP